MTFRACEKPADNLLAIRNPADTIAVHQAALDAQHRFWSKVQVNAEDQVDLARHALSLALHNELVAVTSVDIARRLGIIDVDPEIVERDRLRALGVLGVSQFFRSVLRHAKEQGIELVDGRGHGYMNLAGDIMAQDDVPLEPRIHMLSDRTENFFPSDGDPTDQWYQKGQLYVHKVTPAQPSEPFIALTQEGGYAAPFEDMTTVYPYVASTRP